MTTKADFTGSWPLTNSGEISWYAVQSEGSISQLYFAAWERLKVVDSNTIGGNIVFTRITNWNSVLVYETTTNGPVVTTNFTYTNLVPVVSYVTNDFTVAITNTQFTNAIAVTDSLVFQIGDGIRKAMAEGASYVDDVKWAESFTNWFEQTNALGNHTNFFPLLDMGYLGWTSNVGRLYGTLYTNEFNGISSDNNWYYTMDGILTTLVTLAEITHVSTTTWTNNVALSYMGSGSRQGVGAFAEFAPTGTYPYIVYRPAETNVILGSIDITITGELHGGQSTSRVVSVTDTNQLLADQWGEITDITCSSQPTSTNDTFSVIYTGATYIVYSDHSGVLDFRDLDERRDILRHPQRSYMGLVKWQPTFSNNYYEGHGTSNSYAGAIALAMTPGHIWFDSPPFLFSNEFESLDGWAGASTAIRYQRDGVGNEQWTADVYIRSCGGKIYDTVSARDKSITHNSELYTILDAPATWNVVTGSTAFSDMGLGFTDDEWMHYMSGYTANGQTSYYPMSSLPFPFTNAGGTGLTAHVDISLVTWPADPSLTYTNANLQVQHGFTIDGEADEIYTGQLIADWNFAYTNFN